MRFAQLEEEALSTSVVVSAFGGSLGHVSLDAVHQPLDALGHAVARQPRGGQHHALAAADPLRIVLEQGLNLSNTHAVWKNIQF